MEIDDANDATGGGETHDGGGANDAEKPATAGIAEGTAEAGVDSGPRAPTAPWTESASPTAAKASGSGTAKASSGDASAAADNAAETPPNRAVSSTEASTAVNVNVNVNAPKAEPPAESGRVTASSAANGSPKPTAAVTTATPASKPKPSSVLSGGSSSKQAKSAAASSNAKPVKAKSSSSSSPSKSTTKNGSSSSSNNNTNNNDAISKTTATNSATTSLKKGARKKRKATGAEEAEEKGVDKGAVLAKKKKPKRKKEKDESDKTAVKVDKSKKARKQTKKASSSSSGNSGSSSHPYADHLHALPGLTADQIREQEQMRKALEEEQYSANGSIVDTDSDDDEHEYMYKGQLVRLDRVYLRQASKKCGWLGDAVAAATGISGIDDHGDATHDGYEEEVILREDGTTNNGSSSSSSSSKKKSSRIKKKGRNQYTNRNNNSGSSSHKCFRIDDNHEGSNPLNGSALDAKGGPDAERDEGSIFGQTTGASNSTWVECDKCKKWRRLRGVVDQSKLPKKWYCSMNRNDPERARCSAPEEEYDAPITPESAADARTRKHLRVWVRRLQGNEQYESRLPTLTRNKKRSVASTSKEPHEWVRCCNPSCGKWRAILRIMDAKQNVIDRTSDGEWYCVMNTWDEKTASCAAPQENLPAVGCPPWVLQDVAN